MEREENPKGAFREATTREANSSVQAEPAPRGQLARDLAAQKFRKHEAEEEL
jgi:hypothetical protein